MIIVCVRCDGTFEMCPCGDTHCDYCDGITSCRGKLARVGANSHACEAHDG